MGGRGSSWNTDNRPSAGGDGKSKFSPYGVGQKIPDRGGLKESIGTKGRPYSIDNALQKVNPNHSYEYSEYSENCQRCVVAYELRRRGYDVTALPTYQGDTVPQVTPHGNGRWQMAFRGAKSIKVGSKSPATAQANLEAKMRSFGSGSRGVVHIPGHVFNVENVGGKIRYVEAQTGKKYTSNKIFGNMFSSETAQIRLVRTDNLRISDRARNLVTRAK